MNKIKLTVCIPTLNRSSFVVDELKHWSKIPKVSEIEIIVIDDNSTDDTDIKVNEFIKQNKKINISYFKHKYNYGFDKMILSVIQKAQGDFVWLISDDDLPKNNSLEKLLKIINKNPNLSLIHINYSRFDNILKKITAKRMVGDINKDIYFTNKDKFYFKQIKNSYFQYLGTNVITMSTDIVNKKIWIESLKNKERFAGHNFMHCFMIADMVSKNESIYYVADPIVQYLSNNHRVWPNDIWKDYNSVFLDYLIELGYDKKMVEKMRKDQKKYEQREGISKNPILKYAMKIAQPVYGIIQYLRTKLICGLFINLIVI